MSVSDHCQCDACRDGTIHASDCAVHNAPAYPKGPCDCVPLILRAEFGTHKIFLSRRNLQALLNKLDRTAAGDISSCAIIKHDNQHPVYPQTMRACMVTAVEDSDYYIDRDPGEVDHKDAPPWKGGE